MIQLLKFLIGGALGFSTGYFCFKQIAWTDTELKTKTNPVKIVRRQKRLPYVGPIVMRDANTIVCLCDYCRSTGISTEEDYRKWCLVRAPMLAKFDPSVPVMPNFQIIEAVDNFGLKYRLAL